MRALKALERWKVQMQPYYRMFLPSYDLDLENGIKFLNQRGIRPFC